MTPLTTMKLSETAAANFRAILAIPPAPKSVAEAFYSDPTVIFEGEFK